ncbi:nicotinamide N-methyltransferase [Coniochaeta sp. PMI_546]|nr:nicotinamide N-methyltransferase [Coniochaeta sp. PMI_546]
MELTSRITLTGPPADDPEDFLADSLGVVFPDDIMNLHGDHEHGLLYTSPHLPNPLHISLADPQGEDDRQLMSHYLWNASLQLAELIEAGTLGLDRLDSWVADDAGRESVSCSNPQPPASTGSHNPPLSPARICPPLSTFSVKGLTTLELGAGTALPSVMSSLLGGAAVQVTDYPSPATIANLRQVVARNCIPSNSPVGTASPVSVEGHEWGVLSSPFALENKGKYDRVIACDCLWMPWQHGNLRKSIAWFLREVDESRAWVVAGFHTGREKMRRFFGEEELRKDGLEVERIWEVDCSGVEREWVWDRGREDENERKRWLVVAILKRIKPGHT